MSKEISSANFSYEVERFVSLNPDVSYMDAIIHICEQEEIEIESAARHIKGSLKEKLLIESKKARLMKDNHIDVSLV